MEKIKVKEIVIIRAEGLTHLCGIKQVAKSFTEAHKILSKNSLTAPKSGGYDKHDFTVTYEDDTVYNGRYDLKHYLTDECGCRLEEHMREHLEWVKNEGHKYNWVKPEMIESAENFLEKYELG